MDKRVSSRAIIIEDNKLLSIFRRKIKDEVIKEYYVLPGGGLEENETLEENVIRELKEEFNVDIEVNGLLKRVEYENNIDNYFLCKITNGIPKLGGEELDRMNENNYYEIRYIDLKELDNYDINAKDIIKKYKDIKILNNIELNDFSLLRDSVGWKSLSNKQLETALKNSMCKVSIIKDNKCIACGRVVGDYSIKGVLSDIIVDPSYQGLGYGKIIVINLLNQISNYLGSGERFMLEADPTCGNREFYIKCGMKYEPENQDGLYLWIKK